MITGNDTAKVGDSNITTQNFIPSSSSCSSIGSSDPNSLSNLKSLDSSPSSFNPYNQYQQYHHSSECFTSIDNNSNNPFDINLVNQFHPLINHYHPQQDQSIPKSHPYLKHQSHDQQHPMPRSRSRRTSNFHNLTNSYHSSNPIHGIELSSPSLKDLSSVSPTYHKIYPQVYNQPPSVSEPPQAQRQRQKKLPSRISSVSDHEIPDLNQSLDFFNPLRSTMDPNQNRKFNTLHRNKACLSCRARKTKCDAVKPVCSSCKRLGQSQPIECKYDQPPKWLSDVVSSSQSKEKKKLAELKSKLESLQSKFRQLKLDRSVQEHNYRQLKSFNHLIATNENQSDGLNLSNTKSSNTSHIMHSPESDLTNPSLNETSCSIENSRNPFYQNPDYLSSGPSCSKPIEPQPVGLEDQVLSSDQIAFDQGRNISQSNVLSDQISPELLQQQVIQYSQSEPPTSIAPYLISSLPIQSDHVSTGIPPLISPQIFSQYSSAQLSLNQPECLSWIPKPPLFQSCPSVVEQLSLKQDIQVFQGSLTSPVFAPSTTQTFDPQMAKNELSPLSSNNSLHSSLTLSNEISMASTVVKNRAPGTVTQHHLPSIAICQVLIRAYINKPLCPFNLIEPVEIFRRVESGYFHPSFPAFGLIHSLCAVGAQYVSQAELQQHYHQITEPIEQYHVRWAEFFLEKEMREYNFCNPKDGNRLIEIGQGFIVCSQHYSIKGLPLMMWKNLGCGIKICTALGLDREDQVEDAIPVDENMMIMWPDGVCNFGCSRTQEEYHYRTLLWWYTYCCERMCSSVSGFGVTVSESDASDKWICCSSQGRPDRFKHDLKSEEFFVNHDKPESEFDDEGDGNEGSRGALQLLIKAAILLGRVCSTVYRRSNISKPIKESEQEKEALSNLLMKFYHSFPGVYKKAFKFKFRGGLNSCLLSAHALVHSCLIALHEDEVRTIDLEDRDMKICTDSTRVILNWFQAVTHQNIDIGDLLCSNPTLGHALGVALRTHCKLIAFNETLGNYKAGESLRLELDGMLDTLKACRKLPMGGRAIGMAVLYLNNPSILLPRSAYTYQQISNINSNCNNQVVDSYNQIDNSGAEISSNNKSQVNDSYNQIINFSNDTSSGNLVKEQSEPIAYSTQEDSDDQNLIGFNNLDSSGRFELNRLMDQISYSGSSSSNGLMDIGDSFNYNSNDGNDGFNAYGSNDLIYEQIGNSYLVNNDNSNNNSNNFKQCYIKI